MLAGGTTGEKRTLAGLFATKALGLLLMFVSGVLLARTLGPAGKGSVDVALSLFALLMLLYPSLEEPQLLLLARDASCAGRLVGNALLAALLLGSVIWVVFELAFTADTGVLGFLHPRAAANGADVFTLRWLVLAAPFEILARVLAGVLQGRRNMRAFNAVHLARNSALLLAVILLAVATDGGVRGAVQAWALSSVAAALCALVGVMRDAGIRATGFGIGFPLLWAQISGGLRVQGAVVAAAVILSGDQLILWHFHGAGAVGPYALAAALSGQLRRFVVQPVKEMLGSALAQHAGDRVALATSIASGSRRVVALLLPPTLLLALLAWPLLRGVYGEGFMIGSVPLLILLPGGLMWACAVVLSWWLVAQNRLVLLTLIGLGIAAVNVALNLLLIPQQGAVAAAWTSTACYALHLLVLALIFRAGGGCGWRGLLPGAADFALWKDLLRALKPRR
ncbi:MAG: hypothetical protein EXS14_07215 [Planctomycetes bacterium]|nr:hypothetical protein [Planctomycetota bacterium]